MIHPHSAPRYFCYIPLHCKVCGKEIQLLHNRLKRYETRGYPMFCRKHVSHSEKNWMKSAEGRKWFSQMTIARNKSIVFREKLKHRDYSYLKERMTLHNPMYIPSMKEKWYAKRIYKIPLNEYKIKVAVERLETQRLKKIQEYKKLEAEKPPEPTPRLNIFGRILCLKEGKYIKCKKPKAFCHQWEFCHQKVKT